MGITINVEIGKIGNLTLGNTDSTLQHADFCGIYLHCWHVQKPCFSQWLLFDVKLFSIDHYFSCFFTGCRILCYLYAVSSVSV